MSNNDPIFDDSNSKARFYRVAKIGALLSSRDQTITAVESCTAGGIAYSLTMVPGSSQWFHRSFVAYTNEAKREMVDVPANLLAMHGAVSLEAASAMGLGAQRAALADFGIAVTGIAGPDGGTDAKPVGTVCFGWASPGSAVQVEQARFAGDRNSIRNQAIDYAIQRMLEIIEQGQ